MNEKLTEYYNLAYSKCMEESEKGSGHSLSAQNTKLTAEDREEQEIREEIDRRLREGITQDDIEVEKVVGSDSTSKEDNNIPSGRRFAVWKDPASNRASVILGNYQAGPDGKKYFQEENEGVVVPADRIIFSDDSIGLGGIESKEETDVGVLKDLLLGEVGKVVRNRARNANELIRYDQRLKTLLDEEDEDKFKLGFVSLCEDIPNFSKGSLMVENNQWTQEDADVMRNWFESMNTRKDLIYDLAFSLSHLTEDQIKIIYRKFGEFFIRVSAAGTGREDEYTDHLSEILTNGESLEEKIQELLADISNSASSVDLEEEEEEVEPTRDEEGDDPPSGGGPPEDGIRGNDGDKDNEGEDDNDEDDDLSIEEEIGAAKKDWFDALNNTLENNHDIKALRKIFREQIYSRIIPIKDTFYDEDDETTWAERLEHILSSSSPQDFKDAARPFLERLGKKFTSLAEKEEKEKPPQSFEELLELIMSKETDEFKTGGVRELITKNGVIRPENFFSWVRDKADFWSNFNPDSTVDLFNLISIPMMYRTITLNEMVTNPQYFRRRERKLLISEVGGEKVVDRFGNIIEFSDTNHTDKRYDKMKKTIQSNIFYYNMSRNFSVQYAEVQERDDKIAEAVVEFTKRNHFTKEGFQSLFSLPSVSLGNLLSEGGSEENHLVGEGVALAFNIYDSISDYDALMELLGEGEGNILFSKNYIGEKGAERTLSFIDNIDPRVSIYDLKKISPASISKEAVVKIRGLSDLSYDEDWFDGRGMLKNEEWAKYQFLDYINIFNEAKKDPRIVSQLRERVRQTLAYKMVPGLRDGDLHNRLRQKMRDSLEGAQKSRPEADRMGSIELESQVELEAEKQLLKFAYDDARHAEEVAYSFLKWTGTAAKNDTTATGFDASTKFMETAAYRVGQGRETSGGGAVGNMKDIGINKRLIMPIMMGIQTMGGETPKQFSLQIAKNIGKKMSDKERSTSELSESIVFATNAMREYGANHYARAATVYASLAEAEGLDLSKLVKFDPRKGYVVETSEIVKNLCDNFLKPEKYRVSNYTGVDYTQINRFFDRVSVKVVGDNNDPHRYRVLDYRSQTNAEAMFGDQAFRKKYRNADGSINAKKVQEDRGHFWKDVASLRLSAFLASHTDPKMMTESWSLQRIEAFMHAIRSVPADIEIDEKNLWNTRANNRWLNKDLEGYIRKASHTELWRQYGIAVGMDVGNAVFLGLFDVIKLILSESARVA